jgi:hypothetical protein
MSNPYEQLKQWNDLLKNGTITQEEFDVLKTELLGEKKIPTEKQEIPTEKIQFIEPITDQEAKQGSWLAKNWIAVAVICTVVALIGGYFAFYYHSNSEGSQYMNDQLYKLEKVYNNVMIDGEEFTIKVVSDKFNEQSVPYEDEEIVDMRAPKTLVFYNSKNDEFIGAQKFDGRSPTFSKVAGDIGANGKLYLFLLENSGGSGYSVEVNHIHLENGKVKFSKIGTYDEISRIYFNTNDNDIVIFNGIWDFDNESHFEKHRCKITQLDYVNNNFVRNEIGVTKYKYFGEEYDTDEELRKMKFLEAEKIKKTINSNYIRIDNPWENWTEYGF